MPEARWGDDWVGVTLRRAACQRVVAFSLLLGASAVAIAAFLAAGRVSYLPWPVLALWLASITLFLAGAWLLERNSRRTRSGFRLTRPELLFLVAITFGSLLARTIALGTVPETFSGDEGETGAYARSVLAGELRDPFTTGWQGHPTLWFFFQALSLRLFGDTVVGLRMLSALLGAVAIPVLYFFARAAFGRSVAVVAAVLLSALHFHLHYSRVGLNSVADPLLMLIALGALFAGLRTRSPFKLAFAGVAAGIAQHFYLGSRLVPLVLLAVVLHQLLFNRSQLVGAVRYLPLALVGFWVGYGPGMRVPLYQWNDFNARLAEVGIFQSGWWDERREMGDSVLEILRHQTNQSVGAFTHVADRSDDYWPEMPLLDSVSAALFVLGIGFILFAWRRAETAAILAWLAGTMIAGGVLLVDSPQSHRYVTAAPPACVLVALAIVRTASEFVAVRPRLRNLALALAGALVAGIAVWNLNFYFREYNPRRTYGGFHQGEEVTAIGRYLHERGAGSFVYFFGAPWRFYDVGTIRFLAPEVPGTDVHEPLKRVADLPPDSTNRRPLFIFLPQRFAELSVVRRTYPEGVVRTFVSEVDRAPLFYAYEPGGL